MNPLRPFFRFTLSALTAATVAAGPFVAGESDAACQLNSPGNQIQRVIYIQFDNTHFRRDNVNVPSDLEQMPALLNFIRGNGTLLTNDHTILISHTAGGILSSLTGVYPDRHGQTVSNSYVRTSNTGAFTFPSSFGYWTDPVSAAGTPTVPNMITPDGKTAPAPFVPYTRAGCDVGAVATANIVLENTSTSSTGDITKVFGNPSPEATEAAASAAAPAGTAARTLAQTDFVGIAVHCGSGGGICAGNQNARLDLLPEEPGQYSGFLGLFGAKYVNPAIAQGSATIKDTAGNPIVDPFGQPGFPGFDGMFAATSLAYIAQMQEAGIPITFAYISDAHDFHGEAGEVHSAFGPGDPGYVEQLKEYDAAFAAFFARLAAAGINKSNTLFVFTVDEGDHFVGVNKTNCDGVTTPCIYGTNEVGEIMSNIDTLVQNQFPTLATQFLGTSAPNAFTVHGDDAPTFYLAKKGAGGGALAQTDPLTRQFEQSMANLTNFNPYTGATDRLLFRMADQTEMKLLHMITTGDPVRNATFTYFADANYFITDFPANTCLSCIGPAFAWNHGDDQSEIGNTWIGYVGPGISNRGQDDTTWSDHTDARPTILWLLGLQDSYIHDGRVVVEAIDNLLLTGPLSSNTSFRNLAAIYKQINAPFGQLGNDTLAISTAALASNTANDATYANLQNKITAWTNLRDTIGGKIRAVLSAAAFGGQSINEPRAAQYISIAQGLLDEVSHCAADISACVK